MQRVQYQTNVKAKPSLRDRSLFIAGGDDFWGDHLIFRRTNAGSPETLEGFRERTTQICLENEDMVGGGENRESHQMLFS